MRTPARGQSLVLAALFLLALTLMVAMSLSLGTKVRERVELNTLADATAYSSAVATARAYNTVALMNRAAIAHWINLAGVESLISWTALVFAQYSGIYEAVNPLSGQGAVTGSAGGSSSSSMSMLSLYIPGYGSFSYGYDYSSSSGQNSFSCGQQIMDYMVGGSSGSDTACRCALAKVLEDAIVAGWSDTGITAAEFNADADRAGDQGRQIQSAIGALAAAEGDVVAQARSAVYGGTATSLPNQIVALANGGRPGTSGTGATGLDPRPVPAIKTINEEWMSAISKSGVPSSNADEVWWATMDARDGFTKSRASALNTVKAKIEARLAAALRSSSSTVSITAQVGTLSGAPQGSVNIDFNYEGHGWFGTDPYGAETGPDWTNALAEDKAEANVTFNIDPFVLSGDVNLPVTGVTKGATTCVPGPLDTTTNPPSPTQVCTTAADSTYTTTVTKVATQSCSGYHTNHPVKNDTHLMSSDWDHTDDFADFDQINRAPGSAQSYLMPSQQAITRLTMNPCTDNFILRPCHSVYVGIWGLDSTRPLEGQAKNFAGLTRQNTHLTDPQPWDVKLKFAMTNGADLNLRGTGAGPDIGIGTGLAYYHRPDNFTEKPNMFNPYWRATLVGANKGVPAGTLGLTGQAATAWSELTRAGYSGEGLP